MKNNDFNDVVFNRRSIKTYDTNVKISRDEMLEMIKEATLAPSSINIQPWRFVVVDSKEGKDTLRPLVRFNQSQNDTSSAMVVLFGDMECIKNADKIYSKAVDKGLMLSEVKEQLLSTFVPFYENASRQKMNDMVKIDCSLAAMQFMLVARHHGYDTNAIGGFDEENITKALNFDESRYVPVMIISIGKADCEAYGSVRLEADEVTTFV